jgi:ABC-type transporter Mla subunit MlaD
MDAQNARLEKAGAIVSGASESLASAAGSVASAATPLSAATASLHGAMDNFSGAAEHIRVMSDAGRTVVDSFRRAATQANKSLGSQAENFRSVEQAVARTLNELTGGVQSLGREISQCIETYDNEIARSIGSLEAALIDIGDIVDTREAKKAAETR